MQCPVEYLKACSSLLHPDGMVVLVEVVRDHPIALVVDTLQSGAMAALIPSSTAAIAGEQSRRVFNLYFDGVRSLEDAAAEAGFATMFRQVQKKKK
jgi:hypothetical protein